MRKPRTGSRPSAVDPSPPQTSSQKTPYKPTLELLARFELLWWKSFTWGQKEQLAGVTDRAAFWEGKSIPHAEDELRRLILAGVLLGELELPELNDANRAEFTRLAEQRHYNLLRSKKEVANG
jgi:hypothetical protein